MKKQIVFFVVFFALGTFSFGQLKSLSNGKQIDERLIGTWEGSENDTQMEGMSKKWTMIRNEDGTFHLDFEMTYNEETDKTEETGNWWIENGKFNEYHDYSGMTDIYEYEVLDKKRVKFKSVVMAMDMNTESYEFIDHKIKDKKSKKKNSKQDALSFETALKVKNVGEEYQFALENCNGCKLLQQSLVEHKNKSYDILTFKKTDGEEIKFYFDISSLTESFNY